jgi:GT2 family glycosyltransferase
MRMVDFAESNPDVGLIGCSSILPTGVTERTAKKEMSPWVMHFQYGAGSQIARWCQGAFSRWYHYGSKGFPFSKPTEVDVIQDSFIYIKGELLQKGLRFDECMKLYFTEDDLCLNVKSRGYKVVFYPEVSVRHILQATLDQRDLKVWDMYLDDCVAYLCKYHGVHGKVLEACVRGKRTLKKVLGYVK